MQHTISDSTIKHYRAHANEFWEGTKDHDVSRNYVKFLGAMTQGIPIDILDFGCGPGRDLLHFRTLGHRPVGLDGCPEFCQMAREYSQCTVLEQDFLNLSLPPAAFHGIFANASLFHIPSSDLPRVLLQLSNTLKEGGILFSSNPRGNSEGWSAGRYGFFAEFEQYSGYLITAGYEILEHYYRPEGKPREEQPWLAIVARKRRGH